MIDYSLKQNTIASYMREFWVYTNFKDCFENGVLIVTRDELVSRILQDIITDVVITNLWESEE